MKIGEQKLPLSLLLELCQYFFIIMQKKWLFFGMSTLVVSGGMSYIALNQISEFDLRIFWVF